MKHRVDLQPSSGGLHHGQYIALALTGLRQCDVVNLPGLPVLTFRPTSTIPEELHLLGLLDGSTHLTVMDNLRTVVGTLAVLHEDERF